MRTVVFSTQILSGFSTTNALLQHALPDIEPLCIDIEHLQDKRDKLVSALQDIGYEVHAPEGTFYLLPRSPIEDDVAFIDALAADGVFCLPGSVVEMPGYFRISLTANDRMIDEAIPRFAAAFARAG
jgi:aspartate aminotransferase